MSPDVNTIRQKLSAIGEYIKELKPLAKLSLPAFLADYKIYRTAERNLQLMVDTAVDVNNILIAAQNKPPAEDYFESFIELANLKVYPRPFALRIANSAGMRNRLVHTYETVDLKIIHKDLKSDLADYKKYIKYIYKYLEK